MNQRTIAEELVEQLADAGVKRIYGIVGDSLSPITDAVRRSDRIGWIHTRHEETAAFAAGAEAQLSGQLAACAGSCGPGHVHLINGLFDAHRSMAPVLAIAAHIPSGEIGTSYFQETHPDRLFAECSHFSELISNPGQMPRTLQIALQNAISKQGVAVVAVSGDVAARPMPDGALSHPPIKEPLVTRPSAASLEALAKLLNDARRVTLFCGSGCAGAHDELLALAETLKAPIAYALRGKHFVEYDNPYEIGMTGLIGDRAAYHAMHECDVLLLLGTDFPYEAFMPTQPKIAQVDIRADHLGRRSRLDLGLLGDVRETLSALLPLLQRKDDRGHLDGALREFAEVRRKFNVYADHVGKRRPIHPEHVAATLNKLASDRAIFTVDTGMCTVWAARYLDATRERRIIGSFNHGSMANALPQAIGAQLIYPDRQVIALCGDGGFAMLMGDVLTLLQYELPIKLLIFNNHALGMVKLEQEVLGYPSFQTDLKNPDFAKMAEAIGIFGVRIEDPAEVGSGLERALRHPGAALIDVVTDPNALSLPPHVDYKQVKGMALATGKLLLSGRIEEVVDTLEANVRLV
jgi:pyruvate dehydrogenase (quinone)